MHNSTFNQNKIYDVYIQARASVALAVALRLGIFETLHQSPRDHLYIAKKHTLHPRGAQAILRALSATEILECSDEIFSLSEEAKAYLIKDAPLYLGALIDMENESFLTPEKLLLSAQRGTPSVYGDVDVWETHDENADQAAQFTAAMHSISITPAQAIAQLEIWKECTQILDIGGGSGALSIAISQAQPHIQACIYDRPTVCDIAHSYIKQYGCSETITTHSGDMFHDRYPIGYDAILYSQILHDWDYQRGEFLIAKAAQSLSTKGGWIVIHEKLTDPQNNHKPLANALVNLDMLVWTEGQQYTTQELGTILANSGCTKIETIPTTGYWSATIGYVSPQKESR